MATPPLADADAPSPRLRLHLRTLHLRRPAIAVHGGAGRRPAGEVDAACAGLAAALDAGWAVLADGGFALDAAIAAVASMEASGVFNAGRGAVATTAGTVETDAAVMGTLTGPAGEPIEVSGAACAMTWPEHPIHVARSVAVAGDALLLAGPGADAFAEASGLPRRDPAALTAAPNGPTAGAPAAAPSKLPAVDTGMGTVGAVALDAGGHLGAATSTGGRRGQVPGRVGDSPVVGAGTWCSPGRVAVSATGDGEAFVRAGFAHRIDFSLGAGALLADAAAEALWQTAGWGGTGGAIALDAGGQLVVLHDTASMARGWRDGRTIVAEVAGDS